MHLCLSDVHLFTDMDTGDDTEDKWLPDYGLWEVRVATSGGVLGWWLLIDPLLLVVTAAADGDEGSGGDGDKSDGRWQTQKDSVS